VRRTKVSCEKAGLEIAGRIRGLPVEKGEVNGWDKRGKKKVGFLRVQYEGLG